MQQNSPLKVDVVARDIDEATFLIENEYLV